ncbi:unnamed protein product [Tilletia controversa]|uniref:Linoleate 8R-lipoxygenase n=1 Tax=Tilletia controversa TaxID=13291 RepID=A0A8X7MTC6_9BASI|nr:hypothetical protein CF328_g3821 [Tilletia controversa]KAE8247318.1 hypothetical protein A4X06_0g4541 [Tilletia controversa]CAD6928997.1 unnamed protein product [Tilletia controversa]CAD6975698.1 unnamed protein product [Tilletia controversa]
MPGPISKLIGTIKRKPTMALDGLTDEQAAAPNKDVKRTSVMHDLGHLRGTDALHMAEALKDLAGGQPMDDRQLYLEHGVEMLQHLPPNSGLSEKLSDGFMTMLWRDLPHPPTMYVGPQNRYRSADGSGNNPHMPDLGKAGTPYSRSVPPMQPKAAAMPDPELVFDQLLRREGFKPHPSGLNRLFFSFATVVIHECFQTSRKNPWINETSSYVDLSTLYGNNSEEQATVRTYENGRIWPDVIASNRIMMMPPGVIAILLLFSRHHNHIAERLLEINECEKYQHDASKLSEAQKKWQDEDIFQLSRNINVAFFASIVLRDYVSAILNTVRADSDWHLDLGKEIKEAHGTRVERGGGNAVSCEFAVLYHWHAALSAADDKWMEDVFKAKYPEKSVDDIGLPEFVAVAHEHAAELAALKPNQWTFGGLKRGPDGRFDDVQLAELIKDAVEEPAHAFGARSTPASLKVVDILGQLQARNVFQVCSMNEFRKYLNLKPFESFIEWNSDPLIAKAAEQLYVHIDNLELYPGLIAEETKPAMAGSGVCPGHTIGRGILDDAISLVRSDRFLTHDLNISTLTSWGMSQLQPQGGAYGGMLPVLLMRALPGAWFFNSTYCLLPFYTPPSVRKILHANKKEKLYNTDRPASDMALRGIHSFEACKNIFLDRDTYRVLYGHNILEVTNGSGFMIIYDDATRHDPLSKVIFEPFFSGNFEEEVKQYFVSHTRAQIQKCTMAFSKGKRRQIDVVRDIVNIVPITWLAQKYGIPLKTQETPHGLLSPAELLMVLLALFIYTSFPVLEHANWKLRAAATEHAPTIRSLLEARLKVQGGVSEKLTDWLAKGTAYEVSPEADRLYNGLLESKRPIPELVAAMVGTMIPIAGNLTQQTALLVDLFLQPKYEAEKKRIIELANRDDAEAFKELEGFVYEGMRIQPVVLGLPRQVAKDVVIKDGDREVFVKAGNRLIIGTSKAHLDPKAFPDPEKLNPHRPRKDYILLGAGMHFCWGARLVGPAIAGMLKEIFKLPNVRRAPGRPGSFVRVTEDVAEGITTSLYLDTFCRESPLPTSFRLEFDSDAPASEAAHPPSGAIPAQASSPAAPVGLNGIYSKQ